MDRKVDGFTGDILLVFTADDEEPDCWKCDHKFNDCRCKNCGSWWSEYRRTETIKPDGPRVIEKVDN